MTSLVTTLERTGLVERRSDPDDKRVVRVAITATGSDYLHARWRASIAVFGELIDSLPTEDAAALATSIPALQRLRELDEERRDPAPARAAFADSETPRGNRASAPAPK